MRLLLEFLAEVGKTKEKNLAVETLRRLLAGEIRTRSADNIVQARKLTERLDETLRRYHNRAVDNLQVIEELIALAKEISAATARGAELGLNTEELAFYDALADNGSAKALMAHEQLRILAQALLVSIRNSATIDWTRKESVRAKMRIEVRKLLAKYGYPPDLQRAAGANGGKDLGLYMFLADPVQQWGRGLAECGHHGQRGSASAVAATTSGRTAG